MTLNGPPQTTVKIENSLNSQEYDGIIVVQVVQQQIRHAVLQKAIEDALKCDPSMKSEIVVIPIGLPASRLVYSPVGPIGDYDDVRVFKNSACSAMKRALRAEIKKPLLVLPDHAIFKQVALVTLLGVLEALYTPIQVREHDPSKTQKVDYLGVFSDDVKNTESVVALAQILERGRRVACDIGDCDPERMAPPRVEEYVRSLFTNSNIKLNVVSDEQTIKKEFPLFEAVNRAASVIERHRGRIIFLEYNPPESAKNTLYLVGKGVTYDTGGIDVKINGAMLGMSRDKCGAAAVAGFMQVVSALQPKDVRVVAGLSIVRNSIGANGYVADEVITARSGKRLRVINTDAEGRMIMADVLCKFKEDAVKAVNPHLFTVATLTGHAWLTVGDGYSIVMDNAPAHKANNAQKLRIASDLIADPFEISTIRKEDFDSHKGVSEGDDIVQGQSKPSSQSSRGHQGPAAFLIMASGLDNHGLNSGSPLKYSHLDIAASAGSLPQPGTGSPVLALAQAYLLS